MTFVKDDPKAKAGRARMLAIAQENEFMIQDHKRRLLEPLGRQVTEANWIDAELIATLWVKARRLRGSGRSDAGVLRELSRAMRESGFRTIPAAEQQHKVLAADAGAFEITTGDAGFEITKPSTDR